MAVTQKPEINRQFPPYSPEIARSPETEVETPEFVVPGVEVPGVEISEPAQKVILPESQPTQPIITRTESLVKTSPAVELMNPLDYIDVYTKKAMEPAEFNEAWKIARRKHASLLK
jgi:hypothetical protein